MSPCPAVVAKPRGGPPPLRELLLCNAPALPACMQAATTVARACQLPRVAAVQRAGAQLQSAARISSGAAALRRQQGAPAPARLAAVRAMASASEAGPITKKVFFDITIGDEPAGRVVMGLYGGGCSARPVPCRVCRASARRQTQGPTNCCVQRKCRRLATTSVRSAPARWASATRWAACRGCGRCQARKRGSLRCVAESCCLTTATHAGLPLPPRDPRVHDSGGGE